MSHEQMLAWLDQADPGTVESAADRLAAAAREIHKIADELKVRPQWVQWKGEGADAFRTWAGDLANSTLRLGDFSDGAAKWLREASAAIGNAQVSIPRDTHSAQTNLDAATTAHNDPDAANVSAKSKAELQALAVYKERERLQAAAEMRKLAQTYSHAGTQMDALERPKFPPPPEALQPDGGQDWNENEVVGSGGSGAGTSTSGGQAGPTVTTGTHRTVREAARDNGAATAGVSEVRNHAGATAHQPLPEAPAHVGTKIDETTISPPAPTTHTTHTAPGPVDVPTGSRAGGGTPPPVGPLPLPSGRGLGLPVSPGGTGRTVTGGRPMPVPQQEISEPTPTRGPATGGTTTPRGPVGPAQPVTGGRATAMPGRAVAGDTPGRAPVSKGIVGGRPAASTTGQPAGRLPQGTVVGGETPVSGTTGRGSAGRTMGAAPRAANPAQRPVPAERLGGFPPAEKGIVGGRPQQQARSTGKLTRKRAERRKNGRPEDPRSAPRATD
ncbi:translation initiation factor IF-2 [Streptomyces sp. NPDC052101]|uniref:translation initiation factor IF-2 n=1 Tax=Streptomyces sp. NPDC052101 TaxID=3155763 RepID=UPI0034154F7A